MAAPVTVAETPEYVRCAHGLLSPEERVDVVVFLAENPRAGDLIQGTGGVRKLRWRRGGRGKSGGVRVIYYFHSDAMPLYLLSVFGKNERADLSKAERNAAVEEHLNELGLERLAKQKAYTLSGGERRRLEISRALVTRPKFLLMDEPFSGVDPISVSEVQKIIIQLKARGIGVLITDHNVRETLSIVDRAYLLHQGSVLCEGTSDYLINDSKSREFYLGEDFNM